MRRALERRYGHMAPPFWTERGFHYGFVTADCAEPPHVHIEYRESTAKFWLDKARGHGPVQLAGKHPKNSDDEAKMLAFVKNNRATLLEKWEEHCGGR